MQFQKTMPDDIRSHMLKIWAGFEPHAKITVPLYYLYAHFPKDRLGYALSWLIRNNKTGEQFVDFFLECGCSNLSLHKKLLQVYDRDLTAGAKIISGVNFRE
jgi:hypothetical protein